MTAAALVAAEEKAGAAEAADTASEREPSRSPALHRLKHPGEREPLRPPTPLMAAADAAAGEPHSAPVSCWTQSSSLAPSAASSRTASRRLQRSARRMESLAAAC
eukprot:7390905-Prymnesium_polylepis.1